MSDLSPPTASPVAASPTTPGSASRRSGVLCVTSLCAASVPTIHNHRTNIYYVHLKVRKHSRCTGQTEEKKLDKKKVKKEGDEDEPDPRLWWFEVLELDVEDSNTQQLSVSIRIPHHIRQDSTVGRVQIPLHTLPWGTEYEGTFPLHGKEPNTQVREGAQITVRMMMKPGGQGSGQSGKANRQGKAKGMGKPSPDPVTGYCSEDSSEA
eukprot:NODE_684_length_1263_cov_67.541373_g645_i0.p1 GENE.NODE_684_length_1263_cov_67.541373_g645_i0~~NODE_684_length_1263_cov_67.541373_g645_i0.p1  ORF type:complete len:208 (+),score=20.16 NODE_684_length_1263_cov_67.541373_g645_i0:63-686(+)